MKTSKPRISISNLHPSLLLKLAPEPLYSAPVIINEEGMLIDGYRRFQIHAAEELEAIQMSAQNIFDAAVELNRRTRSWNDLDCFLWARWGRDVGGDLDRLPAVPFWQDLFDASETLLSLLAQQKLTLRQLKLILDAPKRYQPFFERFLTQSIQLNGNETANFIEWSCDLGEMMNQRDLNVLFQQLPFSNILENSELAPKQKGELLLKEMRFLRYPYYHRKLAQLSESWNQLQLGGGIRANKNSYIERGILEVTLSSASPEEFKSSVTALFNSLGSPLWDVFWKE